MTAIRTEFSGDRDLFGGDCALTSTIPRRHPKLDILLPGTRDAVAGMSASYTSFLRGDIIYAANPEAEFNFLIWQDDGTQESKRQWMMYTISKGFTPAKAEEWILRPELAQIYSVENGVLCIVTSTNPMQPARAIVLFRTKKRWELEQRSLQQVDQVVRESEQRIAGSIGDKRVQALPTTLELIPHSYDPERVVEKPVGG